MSNDLEEIKKYIFEHDLIKDLLEHAGCENIKLKNNRYEAMLPSKFNSDNSRAVQIYLNEFLTCKVRSRTFLGKSIFDLISYLVFDCEDEEAIRKCTPKSKRWICEKLDLDGFSNTNSQLEKHDDPLQWLKDLKKKQDKKLIEIENEVLDESILNQYIMYPFEGYVEEGIDYKTQQEFQVGIDVQSERIIYPIHNKCGDIIGIKGRTLDPDYKKKNIPKFMHLYNVNTMSELYNWHRALYYILEQKEIVIYEAEKTCWKSSQWGVRNCVALGSSDITEWHVHMIKSLGLDVRIVLGYDKDKTPKEILKQARKFGFTRTVYAMYDNRKVFSAEKKHSPTDLTKEDFINLYNDRFLHKLA